MTGKRTIRITIERDRVWIIRQFGSLRRTRCESCATEVEFIDIEQAMALTGRTTDEIKRLALAARLHTVSGGEDGMRICLRSLLEGVPELRSFKETPAG
jgi:hypothetical protein